MTREEKIANCPRLRKGFVTALVSLDKHERRYTESTKTHDSLNKAKRENGPDAVALLKGENFPPMLKELPPIEEPTQEEAVAA